MTGSSSLLLRSLAAGVFGAFAMASAYLAWASWPREQVNSVLSDINRGHPLPPETVEWAQESLRASVDRMPVNGAFHVALARLVLAEAAAGDRADYAATARGAADLFASGLRLKPNARVAWRGLFASIYAAEGPSPQLTRAFEGTFLFDRGAPMSALTMLEVALRHPETVTAGTLERVLEFPARLYETWYMRRPMARMYVRLPDEAKALFDASFAQGAGFGDWAERLDASGQLF